MSIFNYLECDVGGTRDRNSQTHDKDKQYIREGVCWSINNTKRSGDGGNITFLFYIHWLHYNDREMRK